MGIVGASSTLPAGLLGPPGGLLGPPGGQNGALGSKCHLGFPSWAPTEALLGSFGRVLLRQPGIAGVNPRLSGRTGPDSFSEPHRGISGPPRVGRRKGSSRSCFRAAQGAQNTTGSEHCRHLCPGSPRMDLRCRGGLGLTVLGAKTPQSSGRPDDWGVFVPPPVSGRRPGPCLTDGRAGLAPLEASLLYLSWGGLGPAWSTSDAVLSRRGVP